MGNCAGVDWASEKHDLLIEDAAGEELLGATFAHTETGIAGLCAALVRHEVALVAIERPDALLVDRILDAGIRVMALHPNQVAAARDRFRASGGKSDRFDRFVLCELARTDSHRFRVLEWPGPVRMFAAIDSPVSLAFLARYPSPPDAKALGERRLAAFLKAHGSPKAKVADQLLARFRDAPTGRCDRVETACRRSIVLALVKRRARPSSRSVRPCPSSTRSTSRSSAALQQSSPTCPRRWRPRPATCSTPPRRDSSSVIGCTAWSISSPAPLLAADPPLQVARLGSAGPGRGRAVSRARELGRGTAMPATVAAVSK